MKKIYIAGPMAGIENFNRNAFNDESLYLQRQGYVVLNPATLPDGLSRKEYMGICFAMLRCADAIVLLPGWEQSTGATAERAYAETVHLPVLLVTGSDEKTTDGRKLYVMDVTRFPDDMTADLLHHLPSVFNGSFPAI